jgi:hypothetical protein
MFLSRIRIKMKSGFGSTSEWKARSQWKLPIDPLRLTVEPWRVCIPVLHIRITLMRIRKQQLSEKSNAEPHPSENSDLHQRNADLQHWILVQPLSSTGSTLILINSWSCTPGLWRPASVGRTARCAGLRAGRCGCAWTPAPPPSPTSPSPTSRRSSPSAWPSASPALQENKMAAN